MSNDRRVRASLAAVLTLGLALSAAAPAQAAAPKRVSPPVISVSPASPSSSRTATFTWTEATTSVTFACWFDGATVPCGTTRSRTFSGLTERTHTFTVRASRTGYKSATSSRSFTVDLTPPTAPSVSAPPAITKDPVAPTFSSTSTDVASYECSLDAAAFVACVSGASISASPDGRHTLAVRAVDRVGNRSGATTVSWVVDTTVAKPVISGGPALVTASTSEPFYFADADADAVLTCSLSSGPFLTCASGGVLTAKNGANTLVVKATDGLGNVALSDVYSWTVNPSTKYALSFDAGTLPAPLTKATGAAVTFSVSPTPTTIHCDVDGAAVPCVGSSVSLPLLADGQHVLTVVVDKGLATANSISYAWTVDTVAPGAPTLSGPSARTNATNAVVSVMPTSLGDTVTCTADGSAVACSVAAPVVLAGPLADGSHTVIATEQDKAGNTASASLTWTVDTVAPTVVSVTPPTAVNGAAVVVFSEDAAVTATSPAISLASGAAVATTRVCLDGVGAVVACDSLAVRTVRLAGKAPLVPGERYVVTVNAAGSVPATDAAGNLAPSSSTAFRAATLQQETSPATVQAWRRIAASAAKGGSYVVEGRRGATATWTFSGTAFAAWLVSGPTFGYAKVYVDGVLKGTYNQYASTQRYTSYHVVKGLAAGTHKVVVVATGTRGSRVAKGADVGIDAFSVGATVTKTPSLLQRWALGRATAASGGYRALAGLVGETFVMTFAGTGITWAHPAGTGFGIAAVYVDGVLKAKVDSYAASARERVVWSSGLLVAGRHTIKIVVLGTKRAAAKGTVVGVDYLLVR